MTEHTGILYFATERFKAFVDAVVAIAMTLLILPLLESVSEAATEQMSTTEFLDKHAGQLWSFALSFVLIASFWMRHHRQFAEVERVTPLLLWLNVVWMATIVWLPVPTAMLGQMDTDAAQKIIYIGTLLLTQIATLAMRVYVLRHPELTTADPSRIRHGVAADIAAIILFSAALVIALAIDEVGYLALLILILTGPLGSVLSRIAAKGLKAGDSDAEVG